MNRPFTPDVRNRSLNRGWNSLPKNRPKRENGQAGLPVPQAGLPVPPQLLPNIVCLNKAQEKERKELQKKLDNLQKVDNIVQTMGQAKQVWAEIVETEEVLGELISATSWSAWTMEISLCEDGMRHSVRAFFHVGLFIGLGRCNHISLGKGYCPITKI